MPFATLIPRRLELYLLDLVCRRYPSMGPPSEASGIADALRTRGYSNATIRRFAFAFDVAVAMFGDEIDKRKEATILKDAPTRKKQRPKVAVPKYKSLAALLNLEDATTTALSPAQEAEVAELLDAWTGDPDEFARLLIGDSVLNAPDASAQPGDSGAGLRLRNSHSINPD